MLPIWYCSNFVLRYAFPAYNHRKVMKTAVAVFRDFLGRGILLYYRITCLLQTSDQKSFFLYEIGEKCLRLAYRLGKEVGADLNIGLVASSRCNAVGR